MGQPYQPTSDVGVAATYDVNQVPPYDIRRETGGFGKSSRSLANTGWIWEVCAMVVSIGALLTTIALLAKMQDQPLSAWHSLVSLNTVVSFLAVISRSALMFPVTMCISQLKWLYFEQPHSLYHMEVYDRASRGGWGSLRFLRHLPFEVASIGAFVSVLAFAVGPFFQQLVNLDTRQVESARENQTAAAFGFAHAYDYPIHRIHGGSPNASEFDARMQGAIAEGLYASNLRPTFNCSSSCTWSGTYTTFGFAMDCRDVTAETLATRRCTRTANNQSIAWDPRSDFSMACTMRTPSNVTLNTRLVPTMIQTTMHVSARTLYPHDRLWDFVNPDGNTAVARTLFAPEILEVAQYKTVPAELNDTPPEEVLQCTASMVGLRWTNVSATGNQITIERTERINLPEGRLDSNGTAIWFNHSDLPPFRIGRYHVLALNEQLSQELTDQSVEYGDEAGVIVGVNVPISQVTGGLPEILNRTLARMTDRIATGPNMQIALGRMRETEIFVTVSWYWLALPIAIEVLAVLLLGITMWDTRAATGRVLWKASALSLLWHYTGESGTGETSGLLKCDARDADQLEDMAKNWEVRQA